MAENLKILVAGDVEGNFDALFKRVDTISKKSGPFDMLLCVGDFFSVDPKSEQEWMQYSSGAKKVLVPTFVLGTSKLQNMRFFPDVKGCELCHNVTYLGDYGIFTGSTGLKLAYVSGKQKTDSNQQSGFSMDSIKSIELQLLNDSQFAGVDVLLTSQWPSGIENFAASLDNAKSEVFGSRLLSRLAKKIKPRYHFAALEGIHYERIPYRNHEVLQETTQHVTRFISLAKVGNSQKLKWLYAFNLTPLINTPGPKLKEQPAGTTPCPFDMLDVESQSEERKEALAGQFFYDVSTDVMAGRQGVKRRPNKQDRPNRPPPKPMGPCWFCLSSPEVEKHLVVSVGEHCYLALPKGGLVPEHVLILPIGHYQSIVELPEDVMEEVNKFKSAIGKAMKKLGKGVVFFERSFKSPHLQIQCVPVPLEKEEGLVDVVLEMAAMQSVHLDEIPAHAEIRQLVQAGSPYFYLELANNRRFVCHIRGRFPLQFGREVLAQKDVLDCPERVDWKNCPSSRDQEVRDTGRYRKLFEPFDFTM